MSVNMVKDALNKYTDAEIIGYLNSTMNGVLQNYKVAVAKNNSDILFANLGDLTMVADMLRAMHRRNQERLAQVEK